MGHIYYRQEKYGMAEYHFRRALSINDRSSVLRCYLGMALHKLKRNPEALDMLGQVGALVAAMALCWGVCMFPCMCLYIHRHVGSPYVAKRAERACRCKQHG